MTAEDLMQPRYKVIADYPHRSQPIGQILIGEYGEVSEAFGDTYSKYPHLFRRLHWAEYRSPGDMPEYVKHGENGMPRKVQNYNMIHGYVIFEGGRQRNIFKGWIPCTAAEYESCQSKKQKI